MSSSTSNGLAERINAGWKPGDPISYVRSDIPDFVLPVYAGQRYTALVPDTLDLQERAALAINVLTRATNPQADYEQYFFVDFRHNPPAMSLGYCDQCGVKFMESLPLMRIITGSHINWEVDQRWMEVALQRRGDDGISYTPIKGRPWALRGGDYWNVKPVAGEQFIEPFFGGRLLSAMMLYSRRSDRALWHDEARRMVDGFAGLAVDRGSYAFFAPSTHYVERGSSDEYGKRVPLMGAHVAFVALGLVHTARDTGYEPALTLAGKLLRYAFDEIGYVRPDGSYGPNGTDPSVDWQNWEHFHMHTYCLLAALEYARLAGDRELLERVRRGFEYGRDHGDTLIGYFPENIHSFEAEQDEMCEVADMIALGLKLTELGLGDYWDDVDRWTRNMFAEGQLTPERGEWLTTAAAKLPSSPVDPLHESGDGVVERNIGAFGFPPAPNEWGQAIAHCCTGNGTRAIYYLWQHMLTCRDGRLDVNLLLNRASPWADVDSHIPFAGQVDIRIKQPCRLAVRIPQWATPAATHCLVSGTERPLGWEGRYALVGEVEPGDVATLTFPIAPHRETAWIEKEKYTLLMKGNDVITIDPPGATCPLFRRDRFLADTTRWRTMARFVSDESIHY